MTDPTRPTSPSVPDPPFPNHERCLHRDPVTGRRCIWQRANDSTICRTPHAFLTTDPEPRYAQARPTPVTPPATMPKGDGGQPVAGRPSSQFSTFRPRQEPGRAFGSYDPRTDGPPMPKETPMPRYRKKPVVIDAMQYTGDFDAVDAWLNALGVPEDDGQGMWQNDDGSMTIDTLEGEMRADLGDWIIRGVKGEFYPCKPDIFEATYESA